MMKVAVFSAHNFETTYLNNALKSFECVLINKKLDTDTAHLAKDCEAIAIFTSDKADADVLKHLAASGVKYIALRSVGFDHVDLKKAKELKLRVANIPAYSPYSVAEHAVAMLMALNRNLIKSQHLMDTNDFRLDNLTGFDVHEKTVGIVGLGKIGEVFSKIMNGFGCKVICYDPNSNKNKENELNLKFVEFKELCRISDIISIHCPLNSSTHHLFNSDVLSLMKKGVFIINTARGSIIKTEDLFASLDSGLIGGLGLDVYEFEKGLFFNDHTTSGVNDTTFEKLRSYSNVLITGHQAFLTKTALQNISETTAHNLLCFENKSTCENEL